MQGLRCHFISMSGKSPTKLELTSRQLQLQFFIVSSQHIYETLAVYWDVFASNQTNIFYRFGYRQKRSVVQFLKLHIKCLLSAGASDNISLVIIINVY